MKRGSILRSLGFALLLLEASTDAAPALPGTEPLTIASGDLSAQMVTGIDRALSDFTARSVDARVRYWQRDPSSPEAFAQSISPNRERLRQILGAVDSRLPVATLEFVGTSIVSAQVAETDAFTAYTIRWPVFEGVSGEGLWLVPKVGAVARVVALPDGSQTPETLAGLAPGLSADSQMARRLAENGCEVIVPVLIDRRDTWSGSVALRQFTNLPHREWIWRQAFEVGRHLIGYEVQRTLAALDFFESENRSLPAGRSPLRLGVAGWGDGGMIAFYAAALDPRIESVLVSGYFAPRQNLWQEPIDRDVFGLLREFGDAEIAGLILPRALVVEYSECPQAIGRPPARDGRSFAAPGRIATPEFNEVDAEVVRANIWMKAMPGSPKIEFVHGTEGMTMPLGSDPALIGFLRGLGVTNPRLSAPGKAPTDTRLNFDPMPRLHRQFDELVNFTQRQLAAGERTRAAAFWNAIRNKDAAAWSETRGSWQTNFSENLIGRLPAVRVPMNPRSRLLQEADRWTSYDVVLDVWPDVFAWGVLLMPKDLKPDERRPVVVCQHGLEGLPQDTITTDPKSPAFAAYQGFAARLADRGFIVFAPHNPYRGGDAFRVLQRKAHPLGASLFSIITAQHERILDWLSVQPFVDPARIAFYGLSYGGKTAMRVPAALDRYCLSICSADFNEWARKCAAIDLPFSYLYTPEYDMYEWNLANTFNYAEMAALIAPRPFMVERGHRDGVGVDEWVAFEYARVRRFYAQLGIGDRTEIEFFYGPHTIHGEGTFRFLHRHLNWPENSTRR